MALRFDHDAIKDAQNLKKHKISFGTAEQAFGDPNQVVVENYWFADEGEQRYQMIGPTATGALLTVVFVYRLEEGDEIIRIISARKATAYETKLYTAQG